MTWTIDNLAPVETLLFRSELAKVGRFDCSAGHPCFQVTEATDNDVFVLPRNAVWVRRDTRDYRFVEPGAILIHKAGSAIERRETDETGDVAWWFAIHPDVFAETLRRYSLSTRDVGDALIAQPQIRYRLSVLVNKICSSGVAKLAAEEEVLSLFFEICEKYAERARHQSNTRLGTAMRRQRLTDTARAFVDANLAENIGLEDVAHAAGSSLFHLCRTFREQTGLTLHAYRVRQRLGRAMDRIVDGDNCSLTDLALDTGFSSHSHLSRAFRQQLGFSPSSLRVAPKMV